MAKNRRILIDTLGISHEAFARNGSSSSENKFIWSNNIKKIEKLQLKEERKVHKNNSLKSKYSKIDFNEWKKYVFSTKCNVSKADLKVRKHLYSKGLITLEILGEEVIEEYSNKVLEKEHFAFLNQVNKILAEIEKEQINITDIKFLKTKSIPKDTTKSEMVKKAKLVIEGVIAELNDVIDKFIEKGMSFVDGDAINFVSIEEDQFEEILKQYKDVKPLLKKEAREKSLKYASSIKTSNLVFNMISSIKKDAYKLELAKLELEYFSKLSAFNWDFKYKFDMANEMVDTMPTIIDTKVKSVKKLLSASEQIDKCKKEQSKKSFSNDAKQKIILAKKTSKDELKNKTVEIKNDLKSKIVDIKQSSDLSEVKPKIILAKKTSKDELKNRTVEIKNDLKSKIVDIKLSNEFFAVKQKIIIVKKASKEDLKNQSAKLKMSGAAKGGLKTKKIEIKHNLKSKIRNIKLTNKLFELNANKKSLTADLFQKIAYENKILHSNLQEIRRKTPIEISLFKYWSSIAMGFIFPGIDSLINKQWTKSIMKLAGTAFFVVVLVWCFGGFPSTSGNGLIGLGHFGAVNGKLVGDNDSRFYLVTGTIAIIMLSITFMYWLISGLNSINVANLARAGVRYSNWRDQKKLLKTAGLPYLLSAPALVFILFIVVLPLLATLLLSFTNFNERIYIPSTDSHVVANGVTTPFEWVGWKQYNYITRVVGDDFTKVLLWTIIWTVCATFLTMFLGTLLALLVNQNRIKGKTFFRVIYILPWAIPAFLTILFFSIFFAKSGTFNDTLGNGLFGRSIDWKNEVNNQKALLIFMQGWLGQSYMFLLVTGMVQSIPKSLYEAARVDGSKPLQQFRTITMPIIVMQIAPLLIGQFTFNFNNFGIIYLFNGGGPKLAGSAGETDIFLSWVYRLVNNGVFAKPGAGAALSLIVSIFVVTPSAFIFFRSKSFRGGNF